MKMRPQKPTFVSMWMLDVFCCALGCVTLLWLLKTREASFALDDASTATTQLSATRLELMQSQFTALNVQASLDETARKLALADKAIDTQANQLAVVRSERDSLAKKLATSETQVQSTEAELKASRTKLALTRDEMSALESASTKSAEELARLTKKQAELAKNAADLEAQLNARTAERGELMTRVKALDEAKKDATGMARELADARAQIVDLQGVKKKLADKVDVLKAESDSRFAGIALTGKRAVFLVDMSGSMDREDENTTDPKKWPLVRDTLVKVMKSLPNLEKFQVIMFSNRVAYLLEKRGWIDYQGDATIQQIQQSMTNIKPAGDTNMYIGLEEAFQYRAQGLDTVYLFSDGLPTSGPGLTAQQEQLKLTGMLSDVDRSQLLAKHVLRTLGGQWNLANPTLPRVRIHGIGFFYESPDVGAFLWSLTRENEGSFVGMARP